MTCQDRKNDIYTKCLLELLFADVLIKPKHRHKMSDYIRQYWNYYLLMY